MARITLNEQQLMLLHAVLIKIKLEMDRLYWNKNQKEMNSPFENTGEAYQFGGVFAVQAYQWDNEEEKENTPNFQYKTLSVEWYKHFGRGLHATIDEAEWSTGFLSQMLQDCFLAMQSDERFQKKSEKKSGWM